mgnify:FL=1
MDLWLINYDFIYSATFFDLVVLRFFRENYNCTQGALVRFIPHLSGLSRIRAIKNLLQTFLGIAFYDAMVQIIFFKFFKVPIE